MIRKLLCLAARDISKKWSTTIFSWADWHVIRKPAPSLVFGEGWKI